MATVSSDVVYALVLFKFPAYCFERKGAKLRSGYTTLSRNPMWDSKIAVPNDNDLHVLVNMGGVNAVGFVCSFRSS